MKRTHLFSFVLGIFALSSCTQYQEEMELPQEDNTSLEVYADNAEITRVGFDAAGDFFWSVGDQLGVTSSTTMNMFSGLHLKPGTEVGTGHAVFTGKVTGQLQGYAVYPFHEFDSMEGSTLNFEFPDSYKYTKVDKDFFSTPKGKGNSFNAPMWGDIVNGSVRMHHMGGVFCIKVDELPVGKNLKMEVSSRQKLNGYFTADLEMETPSLTTVQTSVPEERKVTFYFSNEQSKKSGVFYLPAPVGTYNFMRIKLYEENNEVANIAVGNVILTRGKLKIINVQNADISGGDTGGDITAKEPSAALLFGSQNDEQNLNLNMKSNWHVEVEGQPVTRAATVGNDWIEISPMEGQAGNVSISTKTLANTSGSTRTGRIKIVSDEEDIDLDVLQVSDEAMVVAKPKYTYGPTGGSLELDVDDLEDNFTIETTVGWIKNNSLLDDDDRRLFEIAENTDASPRYGKVIFTSGDQKTKQIIDFEQLGNDGQVNPGTNPGGGILIISSQNQTFDCNRHEFDIEVLSKTQFQVETPSLPWMHHVKTIGQRIHFSVDANATYEGRNALIRIYNTQNNQMTMLSVNQMQKDAIILANPMYQYTQFGGTLKFEVGHNVEYDMAIDVDWIRPAPQTKAFTQDALEFTIAENKTNDNREGHITFTSKDKTITQTVLVKQAQVDAMIIKQTDFKLDDKEQTITVNVESNVPFEIINNIPWVHQQIAPATKGMTPNNLTFLVDENSGYSERSGELLVRSTDMKQRVKISISQIQHNAIVLPRALYTIGYLSQSLTAEVEANVDYNVTTDVDWIHYTAVPTTRALVKSGVTVTIDQNPPANTQSREGHIILTANDGTKAEITIRQLPESQQHEVNVRNRLTAFYKANNGDHWWQKNNWCTDAPLNQWYGIKFENNQLSISLPANNVRGDVDLSHFEELKNISLSDNHIEHLNISNCKLLHTIECNHTFLRTINLTNSSSLEFLACNNNELKQLSLDGLGELKELDCSFNKLEILDCTPISKLIVLNINDNENTLKELKINHLKQLQVLNIYNDRVLNKLDCSNMVNLQSIDAGWADKLYSLNLKGCYSLKELLLYSVDIVGLNISDCKQLEIIDGKYADGLTYVIVWDGFIQNNYPRFSIPVNAEYIPFSQTSGEKYPNENIRFYNSLLKIADYNTDGEVSIQEVGLVKNFTSYEDSLNGIIDFSGFTNLRTLQIYTPNSIELILTDCKKLEEFYSTGILNSVDISQCKEIKKLSLTQLNTLYVWKGFNKNMMEGFKIPDNVQIIEK